MEKWACTDMSITLSPIIRIENKHIVQLIVEG
jgi:hypothetical protein